MSEERQPQLSDVPLEPEAAPAPAPPPFLDGLPDVSNPFAARLRQNPDLGTITPGERAVSMLSIRFIAAP
jgi:hypothetical protein